jgi:hypothetical protein
MVSDFTLHGTDNTQVVSVLCNMRKQLADRQAALSMFAKLEWRSEKRASPLALRELELVLDGSWQALAIQSLQFWFGIEGVHL